MHVYAVEVIRGQWNMSYATWSIGPDCNRLNEKLMSCFDEREHGPYVVRFMRIVLTG